MFLRVRFSTEALLASLEHLADCFYFWVLTRGPAYIIFPIICLSPAVTSCRLSNSFAEDNPNFVRTYQWLHSRNYPYSYADLSFGLPGSYRLPFTTYWSIADQLLLTAGRDRALKVLRSSDWDGGIITEGVDPASARMDQAGRAFATAAGYVAHAICQLSCTDAAKLFPRYKTNDALYELLFYFGVGLSRPDRILLQL